MPVTVEHDIAYHQDRGLIESRHGQLHGEPTYKMNRGAILTQGERWSVHGISRSNENQASLTKADAR